MLTILYRARQTLESLHRRLGDFWWYSLMLFCACRVADLLNAVVGLWIVPKYVDPSELGAVMPLTQFANFLAIPVAAFANTFRNELTRLSISREFGRLKTLMRGVFAAAAVFLFVAIVVARFTFPLFLERIRIVEGSLGLVIVATSFVTAVAPVYANALQVLKKFKAQSAISILSTPVRLVAMLAAMPFRAVTGYFVGQASSPVFCIAAAVFSLRRELSAKAEPYWNGDTVRKFARLLLLFLAYGASSGFCLLAESMVLRQRLPDLDSAGYYMATRFSEIASLLTCTLAFTLFPFTADIAARGDDTRPLFAKAAAASAGFGALVAVPFLFFGRPLLALLPGGGMYADYWWSIPWLVVIGAFISTVGLFVTVEISSARFGFLKWMAPLDIAYPALLLAVTGHAYFTGFIPASWTDFLTAHNVRSLDTMLWWMTAFNAAKAACCVVATWRRKPAARALLGR